MLLYLAYSGYVRGVRSQCLRCMIMLIISCTALHLCIETHERQTCLTLAKNPSIIEKLLTSLREKYGVKFGENKACFWAKRTVAFFFDKSAS